MRDGRWEYTIRAYYPTNVRPPKIPNGLAIETMHVGTASRDTEIAAFRSRMARNEIAYIDVIAHVGPFGVTTIHAGEGGTP